MIPADEHGYTVTTDGPPGHAHARVCCWDCSRAFLGHTLALALKAHRQHVAASDLARQENTR